MRDQYPNDKIVMVLKGAGWYSSWLLKPLQNMELLDYRPPSLLAGDSDWLSGKKHEPPS